MVTNILPTLVCFLCLGSRVGPTRFIEEIVDIIYARMGLNTIVRLASLSYRLFVSFRRRGR